MPAELTWRKAIEKVLGASATPLHYNEITEQIIADGLRQSLGATPAATISAQISSSIKKDGAASPYTRVGKGIYTMTKGHGQLQLQQKPKLTPDVSESDETEAQYEIVSSFGMFWRREAVEWIAAPRLLGMQQIGATPVDFNKQLGIYLLL